QPAAAVSPLNPAPLAPRSNDAAFLVAALLPLAAGTILFGTQALRILGTAAATCLTIALAMQLVSRQRWGSLATPLAIAALISCTLPATAGWTVALVAAAVAMLAGWMLRGALGTHLWHPVALGRVAAQLLYPHEFTREALPVLARNHLLHGRLNTT